MMSSGTTVACSLSVSGPLQRSTSQKWPVCLKLAALIAAPKVPLSKRTPPRALSNLWIGKKEATPIRSISSRPARICSRLQRGSCSEPPQPKISEVSIPRTTAILPSLITRRASKGSRTIRNQPWPGPPDFASMNSSSSWIRRYWSRMLSMSSQLLCLSG